MAWATLPVTEGAFSLNANILANSVGSSIDDLFDIALAKDAVLTTAINDIKTVLDDAINALSATYSSTLTGGTWAAPTTTPELPDLSGAFYNAITAPGSVDAITEMATAPTAPADGNVLSDDAYTGAFALAEAEAIAAETSGLWEAEYGAAANGIGLPSAASEAMMDAVRTQRRQATSKVALALATQKASDLRDDTKWATEQRLLFWKSVEDATMARGKLELATWLAEQQQISVVAEANARIGSSLFQAQTSQFQATIQHLMAEVQTKAEQRNWWSTMDQHKLTDAQQKAVDAREVQQILVDTGKQATYAYAGAVAEQFKAWCSQISYGVSTGSSVSNVTYAGA